MGRLFARILANQGCTVKIFGRSPIRTRRTARELGVFPGSYDDAARADIVIVSVPMPATVDIALRVRPMMKPRSLLIDLSSVKTGIADAIASETRELEYVSLHPLFGPDIDHVREQRMLAVPYRTGVAWRNLERMFYREGAHVFLTTPRFHDLMMAKVQALHHFAMMSLALSAGKTREEFGTRSWLLTQEQFRRIARNWDTIIQIQELNPFAAGERTRLKRVVGGIVGMTERDSSRVLTALNVYRTGHASNK